MRNVSAVFTVLAIGGLTSACAPDGSVSGKSAVPNSAAISLPAADGVPATDTMRTVRIPVEGLSCVACAARVKKTLKTMAGVDEVEVHLGERHARVRFDSRHVTAERLVAAINELGYSAGAPVTGER